MRCWESFAAHSASAQRKKIAPTYEIVELGLLDCFCNIPDVELLT